MIPLHCIVTGSVTRQTDDRRQFEADLFSYAHNWMFIPNRTARDWSLMTAMALIILFAAGGWPSPGRPDGGLLPLGLTRADDPGSQGDGCED